MFFIKGLLSCTQFLTVRQQYQCTSHRHSYHFIAIMRNFIFKCCHCAREVGNKLPKPEHLRLCRVVVDNVKCSYSACERLMTIKLWAMHQAVESITDQLCVCVCVCVCVYEAGGGGLCMRVRACACTCVQYHEEDNTYVCIKHLSPYPQQSSCIGL